MESKMKANSSGLSKEKLITIPRKDTLQQLNEYRLSSHLCDVFLVAGGREFPAHRAVLAAGGGFFRGLFASNMREQAENKIELPQVDPNVMDNMLGYIYTGQIQVTQENAQLIIMAADFLLLEELKHPVDEFLAQVFEDCLLTPCDSVSTLQFACQYNCNSLETVVLKQVCKNVETIISESEELFLELNAKAIEDIISSDDVVVNGEEVVFTALMKWIRHREEREQLLQQLLAHIRLCSLSEDFIHSVVMKDPFVVNSPECVSIVKNGMKPSHDLATPNVPHPRDCLDAYTNAILVISQDHFSFNCHIRNGVWCYIPYANSWFNIPVPRTFGMGMPFYANGSVFTVLNEYSDVYVDRYDLNTNTWSSIIHRWSCPTLYFSRAYLKGILYLVGGTKPDDNLDEDNDDFIPADDVLACDLRTTTPSFLQVASLNTAREKPCVVSDDNYIYVVGGEINDEEADSKQDTLERYDPVTNSWSYLSPVQFSNVDGGSPDECILVNGKIFVINHSDVEHKFDLMYNINTDTWSQIPPAPISTCSGVLTYCQNKLYLISGGHDRSGLQGYLKGDIIKTVCYDLKENVWSDVISSIQLKLRIENGTDEPKLHYVCLAGTVVRLRKDFVSTLQLLEDVDPNLGDAIVG